MITKGQHGLTFSRPRSVTGTSSPGGALSPGVIVVGVFIKLVGGWEEQGAFLEFPQQWVVSLGDAELEEGIGTCTVTVGPRFKPGGTLPVQTAPHCPSPVPHPRTAAECDANITPSLSPRSPRGEPPGTFSP